MRALVFDVDNTLTPPRRPLPPAMAAALAALPFPFHVAAGSNLAIVEEQLVGPLHRSGFRGTFDAFVCNGSDRHRFDLADTVRHRTLRTFDLRAHMGSAEFERLTAGLVRLLRDPAFTLPADLAVVGTPLVDRGSMLNVAPIGRPDRMTDAAYRLRDAFVAYDSRSGYRHRVLAAMHATFAEAIARHGLRITLGGQTSFDIVVAGNDKTYPLRTLLAEGYTRLTYYGDALHEHGNDAAVLGFIAEWSTRPAPVDAVAVTGWQDTLRHLQRLPTRPHRGPRGS